MQDRLGTYETLGGALSLPLEETLRQLTHVRRGQSPRLALESAIALREEITPYLLDEAALAPVDVKARYEAVSDRKSEYCLHAFAFHLLAYFKDERTYQLLLDYFASDADLAEELSGDEIGSRLAAMLVRTYDGSDLRRLKLMVETPEFDPIFRYECLRAYHGLSLTGHINREQVVAYVRTLLARIPADATYDPFYPWLALAAAELREPSLRTEIDNLFDRGLTERPDQVCAICSKDDVASIYARGAVTVRRDILQESYFENIVDRICRWYWFQKPDPVRDTAERALDAFDHDLPYLRSEAKVGRNEPCPCGSGKKYKKCCLH